MDLALLRPVGLAVGSVVAAPDGLRLARRLVGHLWATLRLPGALSLNVATDLLCAY